MQNVHLRHRQTRKSELEAGDYGSSARNAHSQCLLPGAPPQPQGSASGGTTVSPRCPRVLMCAYVALFCFVSFRFAYSHGSRLAGQKNAAGFFALQTCDLLPGACHIWTERNKSSFCSTFLFVSNERFCPTVDHLSSLESLSLHSAVEAGRFTWLLGQHEAERIGADPHHFLSFCLLI